MTSVTPTRGPLVALALVILLAFFVYARLGAMVEVPRVHPDEERYALAGSSLADGDGVLNRGVRSGFGPVHAALLAAVLVVADNRATAYPFWKTTNALLFALSAIPIFLLARRLLSRWWSTAVATFSLLIPSSIYVSVVMTESAAFFSVMWALLAIVLTVERPTVGRQFAAAASIGIATATRSQFALLFVAFIAALAGDWLLRPDRPRARAFARSLWPTLGIVILGLAVFFARPALTASSPSESLGPYRQLWTGYDPFTVLKWTLYHAADLELYLAVVPFAVAPIVLWQLFRQGRGGSRQAGALAVSFVTVNLNFLLIAGAFSSLPYGYDRLHDRYLFYVVPLWFLVFCVWLARGLPRPLVALALGVGLSLLLPMVLPFRQLANEAGVDTVPGALWVWVESHTGGPNPVSGFRLLVVFVLILVGAAAFLPRRVGWIAPATVVIVLVATSVLAWDRMIGAPEDAVFAGRLDRQWIDDQVPPDARVAKLYLATNTCPTSTLTWHALFLTEFFNDTVRRAAYIGDSVADGIPIEHVNVVGGRVIHVSGEPFVADYVFTQPGITLDGSEIGRGTNAGLVLWRTAGPVRVTSADTNEDLRTSDCTPG